MQADSAFEMCLAAPKTPKGGFDCVFSAVCAIIISEKEDGRTGRFELSKVISKIVIICVFCSYPEPTCQ